ncbi:MAG: hypothetical protein WAO12_09780 [Venatoribacter sp.]
MLTRTVLIACCGFVLLSTHTVLVKAEPALAEAEDDFGIAHSLDSSRQWMANQLDRVSERVDSFFIDRFFGEKILEDDVVGSRARLSFHTYRVLNDHVEYKLDAGVKLSLPNTQKRLNLLINAEDDSAYSIDRDPVQNIEKSTYSTALRFVVAEQKKWKVDADLGVRWDIPPDPYLQFRARRYKNMGAWHNRLTQSVYSYVIDGPGEKTELQFNLPLDGNRLLRLSTDADRMRKNNYFDTSYDARIYHMFENQAVAAAFTNGRSQISGGVSHFKFFAAGVTYRRLIYSDWIFAEVTPQFEWREENNFLISPVIMFRIDTMIQQDGL